MTLAKISEHWMRWNEFVRLAKEYREYPAFQRQAAKEQVRLIIAQCQYWTQEKGTFNGNYRD